MQTNDQGEIEIEQVETDHDQSDSTLFFNDRDIVTASRISQATPPSPKKEPNPKAKQSAVNYVELANKRDYNDHEIIERLVKANI